VNDTTKNDQDIGNELDEPAEEKSDESSDKTVNFEEM